MCPELAPEQHFTEDAEIIHAHALLGFLAIMDDPQFDATNPDNFRKVVGDAVQRYGIPPGRIASEFGLHASTPSRWLNNKTLPQNVIRKLVVSWIMGQIRHKVAEVAPSVEDLELVNDRAQEQLLRHA